MAAAVMGTPLLLRNVDAVAQFVLLFDLDDVWIRHFAQLVRRCDFANLQDPRWHRVTYGTPSSGDFDV